MGVKERKERERQQRYNEILEAAHRLFEEKGFLNTTLQDVAKEAEISVGLIYRHFQSKEDIFAALALKGAEQLDEEIEQIFVSGQQSRSPAPAAQDVLYKVAQRFFDYYGPYGEYFDMLIYSYKGLKEVQIRGATLTRLMSLTLSSLDKIKNFIQSSPEFAANDEDEALRVVFLLWGVLLGAHKLFDDTGRGHLFAFSFKQQDFVKQMLEMIFQGVAPRPRSRVQSAKRAKKQEAPTSEPPSLQ